MRRIRDLYCTILLLICRVGGGGPVERNWTGALGVTLLQALVGFAIVIWFQKLSGIQVVGPGRVSRLRWTLVAIVYSSTHLLGSRPQRARYSVSATLRGASNCGKIAPLGGGRSHGAGHSCLLVHHALRRDATAPSRLASDLNRRRGGYGLKHALVEATTRHCPLATPLSTWHSALGTAGGPKGPPYKLRRRPIWMPGRPPAAGQPPLPAVLAFDALARILPLRRRVLDLGVHLRANENREA
jgi:hypothetical protein